MNSHITDKFRKAFAELPADVENKRGRHIVFL